MREIYRDSLYCTAKYLLGYRDLNLATHGDLIRTLESPSRRKLIVMPRGTFKTSLCSVATPIWMLLRNPNLRILIDSELYSNSKNILREIKSHYEGDMFRSVFGTWRKEPWNEGEIIVAPRTIVKKEASITCSGIGAQKTGQHFDVIIGDDLNSAGNSNTPEGCEKVRTHYKFYTSLLEPEGTIVIVGTRYSASDLIAGILENEIGIDDQKLAELY